MREVVDPAVGLRYAHQLEQFDGTLLGPLLSDDVIMQPDHLDDLPADPVEGVQTGQRVLEDHADLRAADLLHILGLHREQVVALEQRPARNLRPAGEPHDRLSCDALA